MARSNNVNRYQVCPVEPEQVVYLRELVDDDIALTKSLTDGEKNTAASVQNRLSGIAASFRPNDVRWAQMRLTPNQAVYLYEVVEFDLMDEEVDLTDKEVGVANAMLDRLENNLRNFIKEGQLSNGTCEVWISARTLKVV